MKKFVLKNLAAVVVLFALAASVFAYFAGVEGKYKGSASIEGMGNLQITAELKGTDDKLTGVINSTQGDAEIVSGNAKDGKVELQIKINEMSATIGGTVDDKGKIAGTISGEHINGTIEMTRVEQTPKVESKK